MKKGYLTDEMMDWLYCNYPQMTNENLARELSEMIKKENEKEIPRLSNLLESVTMPSVRRSIESEIMRRRNFTKISIATVKRAAASIRCPKKTFVHVASVNRKKARKTNLKRWQEKAQVVEDAAKWFRSFRCREIRICHVKDDKELKSLRNAILYFNHSASDSYGYRLSSEYYKEAQLLRVVAIPITAKN